MNWLSLFGYVFGQACTTVSWWELDFTVRWTASPHTLSVGAVSTMQCHTVCLHAEFSTYTDAIEAVKKYGSSTGQLFVNPGSQGYLKQSHPLRSCLKYRSLKLACVHHGRFVSRDLLFTNWYHWYNPLRCAKGAQEDPSPYKSKEKRIFASIIVPGVHPVQG